MDKNFNSFSNLLNTSNAENPSPPQQTTSQNFSNFPLPVFHPNIQNYGYYHNFGNYNRPPNFENPSNFANPYPMYPPLGYFNPIIGNNFTLGFSNTGMSSASPQTQTSTRKDIDSGTDTENSTPIGSNLQSQIPPYSTQFGLENISPSKETVKENDGKRVPCSLEDDQLLASAWLTISNCSIVGNFQNEKTFSKRVTKYFNENRHSGPARKDQSLKSHCHWLNRNVNEFNQYYNKLVGEKHSGWNEDQLKQCDRELFHENNGKHFTHEHVWTILKDDPKWKVVSPVQRSTKKSKISESGAYTSSSNAETSVEIDEIEEEVRPVGQKAAKKGKRKAKANVSDDNANEEYEQLRSMVTQQEDKKWQAIEEYNNIFKSYTLTKEYEILFKDTTGMTEAQLQCHERICAIIKAKYDIP